MLDISNKICFVLLHGKSIEQLETDIVKYKDFDICYIGLGLFTIFETFILSKINKHLDIVFDCASVANSYLYNYETKVRLPRLEQYLSRDDNNLWVTSYGIIRDSVSVFKPDWLDIYKDKIFIVDSIFPDKKVTFYMSVPNSVCLAIAYLLWAKVKKIILFGFDGFMGNANNINSYYKPDYHKQEQIVAIGQYGATGLFRDMINFQNKWPTLIKLYRELFNNNADIINCSPNSYYTIIRKIDFDELEKELKKED